MSVQFAGSRSMDERRRRRLAVNGDGADAAELTAGEEKFLPDCVPAELCAASPWIPQSLWKLWTLAGLILAGLVAVAAMVIQTPSFRPELAPALDPLFRGEQPKLVSYLETIFWTLSGQLALLVGWHRSRSRLDFRGRYRVWPWAAGVMFLCGLCAATGLHVSLGTVIDELGLIEQKSPRLGWMLPAVCVMLPLWLLIDRDMRRSLASVILVRLSLVSLLSGILIGLYGKPWIDAALVPAVELICGLVGSALLMLALWVQGWFVAYVTPDPPSSSPFRLPKWNLSVVRWLFGLIWRLFQRKEPAAPAARKRKKADETGTTKRKRKPKRTARKPRTKVAAEEEEASEEDEEEAAEEESEEEEESAEAGDEESYEEEEDEETAPNRYAAKPQANYRQDQRQTQAAGKPHANFQSATSQQDDDEGDDDGDEDSLRADGPPADQLKGLSKRQRRALIKQYRDQQRNQRTR